MKTLPLLFFLINAACSNCEDLSEEDTVHCLANQPTRDLKSSWHAQKFLSTHKVYLTMTSSPARLGKIELTLRTLNLDHVEKVFIALPKLYRNKEPYDLTLIKPVIEKYPKIEIIARGEEDLGPIMKMLPAIELVARLDPEALVISVDDDSGYSNGLINEFIYFASQHPDTIFSGWGNYVELHGIAAHEWPRHGKATKSPLCGSGPFSYCDTAEGWRSIAYRPRLVNTKRLRQLANISKACRTSDDITISYSLAESGIDRVRLSNKYIENVVQFPTNKDSNALHFIKQEIPGWSPRKSIDGVFGNANNAARYQRCVLDIIEAAKT